MKVVCRVTYEACVNSFFSTTLHRKQVEIIISWKNNDEGTHAPDIIQLVFSHILVAVPVLDLIFPWR
jgi:hypothetical protein